MLFRMLLLLFRLVLLLLLFALSFRFCSLLVEFLCCVIIDTQVKQISKQTSVDEEGKGESVGQNKKKANKKVEVGQL